MAHEMGVKTINVVDPNTPDLASVLSLLSNLGGDINITDDYVNTAAFNELLADVRERDCLTLSCLVRGLIVYVHVYMASILYCCCHVPYLALY